STPLPPSFLSGCACGLARADDLCEDVRLTENEHLVGAELDLGAAVLGEDHLVALGDVHRNTLAVLVAASGAGGENAPALWLLLRGVGKDDAADRHLLLLEHLDDQAVTQRLKIHIPCLLVDFVTRSGTLPVRVPAAY